MPHDIGPDGTDGWDGQHLSACHWVGRTAPPFKGAVPSVRPLPSPTYPQIFVRPIPPLSSVEVIRCGSRDAQLSPSKDGFEACFKNSHVQVKPGL